MICASTAIFIGDGSKPKPFTACRGGFAALSLDGNYIVLLMELRCDASCGR